MDPVFEIFKNENFCDRGPLKSKVVYLEKNTFLFFIIKNGTYPRSQYKLLKIQPKIEVSAQKPQTLITRSAAS